MNEFVDLMKRSIPRAQKIKILILLGIGGAVVMMINPVKASSRTPYAYCMRGPTSPGLSNCTFTSMAQCRATASGRPGMHCIANPFYRRPVR